MSDEFTERSRQLQGMLRAVGYVKGDGVSNPGIRLVSRAAAARGLRDWPHTRSLEDYDALIAAVKCDLEAEA